MKKEFLSKNWPFLIILDGIHGTRNMFLFTSNLEKAYAVKAVEEDLERLQGDATDAFHKSQQGTQAVRLLS